MRSGTEPSEYKIKQAENTGLKKAGESLKRDHVPFSASGRATENQTPNQRVTTFKGHCGSNILHLFQETE